MANKLKWLPSKRRKERCSPVAFGAAAFAWAWMANRDSSKPQLVVGDGELKSKVLPQLSVLHQEYSPAPLAVNAHMQSMLTYIRGIAMHAGYRRQLVIAQDGGTLALDWFRGCDVASAAPADTPVLLVCHGLNGGSHEGYCKWVCAEACRRGWRAVVLNYRGCAGLPLTSPRGYAATLSHDVHYAITSIKGRFPSAPVFAVGYSLGGLLLTKYLAESDSGLHTSLAGAFEGSGLAAAAVVSSPGCLHNSAANLSTPWTPGYLYNILLTYKMREFIASHGDAVRQDAVVDLDRTLTQQTVAGFEEQIMPSFGFGRRQEYYDAVASLTHIPHITTPTLFLVSRDDPFLGVLPDQECSKNPNTLLAVTERGGHVAFLTGLWPFGPAYMDAAVLQFLDTAWKQLPHRHSRHHSSAAGQRSETADGHSVTSVSQWGDPVAERQLWLDASVLPSSSPHVPVVWSDSHQHTAHLHPAADSSHDNDHSSTTTDDNLGAAQQPVNLGSGDSSAVLTPPAESVPADGSVQSTAQSHIPPGIDQQQGGLTMAAAYDSDSPTPDVQQLDATVSQPSESVDAQPRLPLQLTRSETADRHQLPWCQRVHATPPGHHQQRPPGSAPGGMSQSCPRAPWHTSKL